MISLKSFKSFLLKSKWSVLTIIVLLYLSFSYYNKIFAVSFVDEQDNFALGKYLLENQKLYSDLFSHHQPLGYIFSAGIQSLTSPENIYQLIKFHREFMIIWSLFWCLILIWRFKEKLILPIILYEVSKFYLLGDLFLSESLSVYPILYLVFLLLEKSQIKNKEYFLTGFFISLSALLLAPIWPFLAGYIILLIWIKKINLKQFLILTGGGLIPILISLPFIDLYYYFHNVFYINYKYYIPQSAEEKFPQSLVKAFFTPLTIYLSEFSNSGLILKITGAFFIFSTVNLLTNRNYKIVLTILILLTLANFRYYSPGLEYSAGFHLLIWYALFIFLSFYFFLNIIQSISNKKIKICTILFLSLAIALIIFTSKDLFKKSDWESDFKKNYSKQYEYGEAIKIMKNPGDTLFTVPDGWLLYIQGDIKNNNKMVNFYGWMSLVWELNDPVIEQFKNNPPTFFYCECDENYVLSYSENYHQLIKSGAKSPLWILNDKFKNLTEEQKNGIRALRFEAQ